MIRDANKKDAQAICDIYNHYIANSVITFEEQLLTLEEMKKRILEVTISLPWIVYDHDGVIEGYAYATIWKNRSAYRYSAESTVYLSSTSVGKGFGSALYTDLISRLKHLSFHCVIGGIALPNPASIALHEKMGFEKVAHFKQIGWKQKRWVDVGYWELSL